MMQSVPVGSAPMIEVAREELRALYEPVESNISSRLDEFREIWETRDESRIKQELLFCVLTPQSRARVCWEAIDSMTCSDVLLNGDRDAVLKAIGRVRFKYKKTGFLISAREMFERPGSLVERISSFREPREARDWFAENIKGIGLKEAGHFLRNIGLGRDLAILDRHILRNLVRYGVLGSVPDSMSPGRYHDIEMRMEDLSKAIGIPMDHLDLLLWYKEAGEIFK